MKLGFIPIALLIFSGIVYLGIIMVNDAQVNYGGLQGSDTFSQNAFNKINETINITQTINSNFETQQISSTDAISSLFVGGFSIIKIVRSSSGLVNIIIFNIGGLYGIDPLFLNILILIFSMLIIFAAISAVFRWGLI